MTATIEERTAAREAALRARITTQRRLASPADYVYCKSEEKYIDLLDNTVHSKDAVDASIPRELWRVEVVDAPETPQGRGRPRARERLIRPSSDIARIENNQWVEAISWLPGRPQLVHDLMASEGGLEAAPGRRMYNRYRPPPAFIGGDAALAFVWTDHIKKLWPDAVEHEFFFDYCAHMLQEPHQKCNSAIVLSGTQGIGKDAALMPIRHAVGVWNCKGIDPDDLFSAFRPFIETLMLTIDEVRPSHDEYKSSAFYNILKTLAAAPPEMLPLNNKNEKLRYVMNALRVFITTNDFMSMFIPENDRRIFIMHSVLEQNWHLKEGKNDYFERIFSWFDKGNGFAHVAAWLKARDLSKFDSKKPAPKTVGWDAVANTWGVPEDGVELALEGLGRPDIVFPSELLNGQFDFKEEMAGLIKSPRKLGARMQRSGYLAVMPKEKKEWNFVSEGRRVRAKSVFVKQELAGAGESIVKRINEKGAALAAKSVAVDNVYKLKKEDF